MSSTDPRAITLSPGLVSTSSDEVERVLSALMARREPLAAVLAGGADSRWKLRLVGPMRQYIVLEPLSGGGAIPGAGHAHPRLANRAPGDRHRERGSRSAALPPLGALRRRERAAVGLPVRRSLR